ncbi:hypothetical protein, partial [Pseudomonas agarici]
TVDLLHAMQALSQLSYSPTFNTHATALWLPCLRVVLWTGRILSVTYFPVKFFLNNFQRNFPG